jgi:sulfur relay (sulfurtransferase) complex TusBCD TusD component (DsrE family)
VGWPAIAETMDKVVSRGIQIYSCGACSRARGITEADLARFKEKLGCHEVLVYLVEWADKIMTL